jgi:hypothetical protein
MVQQTTGLNGTANYRKKLKQPHLDQNLLQQGLQLTKFLI